MARKSLKVIPMATGFYGTMRRYPASSDKPNAGKAFFLTNETHFSDYDRETLIEKDGKIRRVPRGWMRWADEEAPVAEDGQTAAPAGTAAAAREQAAKMEAGTPQEAIEPVGGRESDKTVI